MPQGWQPPLPAPPAISQNALSECVMRVYTECVRAHRSAADVTRVLDIPQNFTEFHNFHQNYEIYTKCIQTAYDFHKISQNYINFTTFYKLHELSQNFTEYHKLTCIFTKLHNGYFTKFHKISWIFTNPHLIYTIFHDFHNFSQYFTKFLKIHRTSQNSTKLS